MEWEDQEDEPVKKKSDGPGNTIETPTTREKCETVTCPMKLPTNN